MRGPAITADDGDHCDFDLVVIGDQCRKVGGQYVEGLVENFLVGQDWYGGYRLALENGGKLGFGGIFHLTLSNGQTTFFEEFGVPACPQVLHSSAVVALTQIGIVLVAALGPLIFDELGNHRQWLGALVSLCEYTTHFLRVATNLSFFAHVV